MTRTNVTFNVLLGLAALGLAAAPAAPAAHAQGYTFITTDDPSSTHGFSATPEPSGFVGLGIGLLGLGALGMKARRQNANAA